MGAMMTDRSYRLATDMEAVRKKMVCCTGTQFDPMVIEEFLEVPDAEWEDLRREVETVSSCTRCPR